MTIRHYVDLLKPHMQIEKIAALIYDPEGANLGKFGADV